MGERRTATYKIITDSGGNRYTFFCDLTGAFVCTTKKTYKADTPEQELLLAWEKEGKKHFNICHKCGQVIKAPASFCPDCEERLSSETLFDRYKQIGRASCRERV